MRSESPRQELMVTAFVLSPNTCLIDLRPPWDGLGNLLVKFYFRFSSDFVFYIRGETRERVLLSINTDTRGNSGAASTVVSSTRSIDPTCSPEWENLRVQSNKHDLPVLPANRSGLVIQHVLVPTRLLSQLSVFWTTGITPHAPRLAEGELPR